MIFRKDREIESNVLKFLEETSDDFGNMSACRFYDNVKADLYESGISSPIEDIFYIAINYKCHEREYLINPYPDYDKKTGNSTYPDGIYVYPQHKVGKYKVDFLVNYQDGERITQIIVELDGHEFHDKNKKQRAYEKERDRYFVKQGYKLFHYTGSEVVSNPFMVAEEVLNELTKRTGTESFIGFD